MTGQVIVIGAGIIGMCAANYLQPSGLKVTVLDAVAPGKSCPFGNAGALSSKSWRCLVCFANFRWLTDDMGPLVVGWRYLPRALPWLWRFVEASRPDAVERSADALIALTRPLFENLMRLLLKQGRSGSFSASVNSMSTPLRPPSRETDWQSTFRGPGTAGDPAT
jgi:2-polyprenyl-6-methoxyphenol hydroxylase-like FAD-dependent oxidoreductase